ncbi:putative FAD-binding dehydrogenase [compost metagenome]
MASIMGGLYPSGGINLGPAVTFGYIAGRHAAGVQDYESPMEQHINSALATK